MNSETLLDAIGGIDDRYIVSAQERLGYALPDAASPRRRRRNLRRAAIIAAAAAALLAASAYAAAVSRMNTRDVSEADIIITGEWNGQTITLGSADMELTFDVAAETCYEAELQADYLPDEPQTAYPGSRSGWYKGLYNWGETTGELPYVIAVYDGEGLRSSRFYLNGKMEIVKRDEWNGWQRTEIYGDYRDFVPEGSTDMLDRRYLLLFSEENSCLLYIASSMFDFDELERIAEGVTVEMTDAVAQPSEFALEVCCFDLGRG